MRTVSAPAVALMVVAGCATQPPPDPFISSTQGTTLVRSGQVTDVHDLTATSANGETGKATRITVRFEDGETRTYEVTPDQSIRVGETVKVTTNNRNIRITR